MLMRLKGQVRKKKREPAETRAQQRDGKVQRQAIWVSDKASRNQQNVKSRCQPMCKCVFQDAALNRLAPVYAAVFPEAAAK